MKCVFNHQHVMNIVALLQLRDWFQFNLTVNRRESFVASAT